VTVAASLVFDLDGTISDPVLGIGRSINHALESFGYPAIAEREVSKFVGPPLDQTFRSIVGPVTNARIAEFVSRYRERYADVGFSENVLYPGIADVIHRLDEAGVALGICTSKPVGFADRILRLFDIREHFHFISGGDIGIAKRDQLASLLAERLVGASSCMIGDRAIDVIAAKANGLVSVGVLWGHGSLEELQEAAPDFLLSTPHQLLAHAEAA
jgi:phosphoglycolate phosphatase